MVEQKCKTCKYFIQGIGHRGTCEERPFVNRTAERRWTERKVLKMQIHKCNECLYKGEHHEMMFKPFGVCTLFLDLIDAEEAYNAEICPFEQKKDNSEASKKAWERVSSSIEECSDALERANESMAQLGSIWTKYFQEVFKSYVSNRVAHLALYSNKMRVRKKNLHRIEKEVTRKGGFIL